MKMNAGVWIGLVAGLGGLIIGVGSVLVNGGPAGVYIAAGILLLFGGMFFLFYKLLFAPMILASRLRKTGLPGKALIKEVRDTGVTVNNSPQVKLLLEIKNSFGQKYTTTIRTLVSRLQPFIYQPGMTIPVLIDPKDENKVVIDSRGGRQSGRPVTGLSDSGGESQIKEDLLRDQQRDDAIRLTGKAARAIVKKYTWLGININGNNPYAEIEVEVMPADAPAFSAKVKAAIMESSLSKYQPGEEIFVKYDAYDQTKVAIDHSGK
ncbi:MAG: hypothetical protein ABIO79_10750 [Ferruginibacter sp.]